MRSFAVGSLALIALYALLQPNTGRAVTAGGNAFTALLRRALAPDVAGVPAKHPAASAPTQATPTVPGPSSMGWRPGEVI